MQSLSSECQPAVAFWISAVLSISVNHPDGNEKKTVKSTNLGSVVCTFPGASAAPGWQCGWSGAECFCRDSAQSPSPCPELCPAQSHTQLLLLLCWGSWAGKPGWSGISLRSFQHKPFWDSLPFCERCLMLPGVLWGWIRGKAWEKWWCPSQTASRGGITKVCLRSFSNFNLWQGCHDSSMGGKPGGFVLTSVLGHGHTPGAWRKAVWAKSLKLYIHSAASQAGNSLLALLVLCLNFWAATFGAAFE